MAKNKAQKPKAARQRRTEAEMAQDNYDKIRARLVAKGAALATAKAQVTKAQAEYDDLQKLEQWWASNPLVEAVVEEVSDETQPEDDGSDEGTLTLE